MRRVIAAIAFVLLSVAAVPAAGADTVYVMRHLHKAAGDDPPLKEEGAILAQEVAGLLGPKDFNVRAVFATRTRRATQTAEPLAKLLKVPVTPYDPRDVPALVAAVGTVEGNVLIVGHSNTVPEIVAAFGGTKPAPIAETEYGTIYQVRTGTADVRQFYVPIPPKTLAPGTERGR